MKATWPLFCLDQPRQQEEILRSIKFRKEAKETKKRSPGVVILGVRSRKWEMEDVSGFGIGEGEITLSSLDVVQGFSFFLQMGFTLILATLDGLDVCLLGDVIGEDDCDDDG
ncbi:hypothetical protein Tco_0973471 [Tanacetum coccineum]